MRALAVAQLGEVLAGELEDRGATTLLTDLELPLSQVLARMEQRGIAADVTYLRELKQHFGDLVATAASEAYAVIGREVNLGSPKQLQEVLFDQARDAQDEEDQDGLHDRRVGARGPLRQDARTRSSSTCSPTATRRGCARRSRGC